MGAHCQCFQGYEEVMLNGQLNCIGKLLCNSRRSLEASKFVDFEIVQDVLCKLYDMYGKLNYRFQILHFSVIVAS